jgi:AcrR family transcriptional regulator
MNRRTPPHRRRPHGEKTRQRLIDAVLELLDGQTFDDIRIVDITRQAGTATGSFHYHFEDKEELFAAMVQRMAAERLSAAEMVMGEREWEGASLRERVRRLWIGVLEINQKYPGYERAKILRTFQGRGGWHRGSEGEVYEKAVALLDRWLLDAPEEIPHPDPRVAVQIGLSLCLSTITEMVLFPATRRRALRALSDPELAEHLTHLLTSYLLTPPPAA